MQVNSVKCYDIETALVWDEIINEEGCMDDEDEIAISIEREKSPYKQRKDDFWKDLEELERGTLFTAQCYIADIWLSGRKKSFIC